MALVLNAHRLDSKSKKDIMELRNSKKLKKEEYPMSEEKKAELKLEDLAQVAGGGEDLEHNYTVFACNQCGHEVK